MHSGSFSRVLCSDIIQLPRPSYEDYLKADTDGVLNKDEFDTKKGLSPKEI